MKTGDTGLNLIKAYEGLRLSAQSEQRPSADGTTGDPVWSIGYGHKNTARQGMTVTEREASRLLAEDIAPIETIIRNTVRAPLNQNEHDALVSLIFNIGEKNWKRSTVLAKLNDGDKLAAAEAFERWSRARVDGRLVKLDGLVRRRAAEKSLFLMPTDAELVVPTSEVVPADECDGAIRSESNMANAPLFDLKEYRRSQGRNLTDVEKEGRLTALYHASQALSGDPSKMIVSKAEEREDIGVTIGAAMAGVMAFAMTILGAILVLQTRWPDLLSVIGLGPRQLARLEADLPLWLLGSGAAACYFILYVLAKRATRHGLKRRRAMEIARVRYTD
ncbi:lysozyme [Parvularcula sp. LCG005]|uniref:lysozyme n=1 Tax=Parvularcula sp. LCG005 TaxID=3078805 RepID=UPI0029424B29|nr:lysozyme [Parvularcula sp. LCG005]WOI54105.1 lysozyme [Parvularcula sp. LCG005]